MTTEIKVKDCDNCPLWNDDRGWCQHPNTTVTEFMAYPTLNEYFAACPLKTEPLTINLEKQ